MYVDIHTVYPSQHRYSSLNVKQKIEKGENDGYHCEQAQLIFHFDNGKSIYAVKNAIPVLKVNSIYILVDGHHSVLASIELGASTVPVHIIHVLTRPLDNEFWQWAATNNYAYLIDIKGNLSIPPPDDITQLQDDPLRYFAAITARKYEEIEGSWIGAENPLWIKVGKDIPFIEMKIADLLRASGFSYQYGDELVKLDLLIDQARAILVPYLPELKLVLEKPKSGSNHLSLR